MVLHCNTCNEVSDRHLAKSSSELIENNSITINTNNSKPVYMYEKKWKITKALISEASARRLQPSQPLYCLRLQYQEDVAEHTFPVSNFSPLSPLQHMKDCKNHSLTPYIYCFKTWKHKTTTVSFYRQRRHEAKLWVVHRPDFTGRSKNFLPESVLARKVRCDATGTGTRLF